MTDLSISISATDPSSAKVDVVAFLVTEGSLDGSQLKRLDSATAGALKAEIKRTQFEGKHEQVVELCTTGRLAAGHLLLVGVGPASDLRQQHVRAAVAAAVRRALGLSAASVALASSDKWQDFRVLGEAIGLGAYRFDKYLTGDRLPRVRLSKVQVLTKTRPSPQTKAALNRGLKISAAVNVARDAVNEPPNELYPQTLAKLAEDLGKTHGLKVKVLDKKGIQRAGMKLHYAVGQGSSHDPRFIHMVYAPKSRARRKLVFVGKGLTFDSGGLSIKPASGMGEMKSDMGGAAAVLGLMAAVAIVSPAVEVHGIIGAAENMPDGSAYRPGDVFGSLDGKTVEIVNTDAEGRLVLADALTYASRLKPDLIVDAATLTGACLVALGKGTTGFYATDDELARRVDAAAEGAGESFWRMPLLEELVEQLKSDVADLKHTGERWGGSITAALFLREFVGQVPWIHCDVAGPVLADRARGMYPQGGTGHPVLTFLRLVEAF